MTPNALKNNSRLCLQQASYSPKKLTLLCSGIVIGSSFLTLVLDFLLGLAMENTDGLSGLDTRAILETVSMLAELLVQLLAPLLTMGFLHCTILLARQKEARPKNLLMGLRRWGVILCSSLFQSLLYLCVLYVALQIASIVFAFLPGAMASVEPIMALLQDPQVLAGNMTDAQLLQFIKPMIPVYIITAVLFVAVSIPLSYRMRLAFYRVMDETRSGPVKAVFESMRLMKGNCIALFKLDLSFWWYYVLQFILSACLLALLFLPGITGLAYLVGYGVCCLLSLLLEYKFLAYVQVSYALFYDALWQKATAPTLPKIEE